MLTRKDRKRSCQPSMVPKIAKTTIHVVLTRAFFFRGGGGEVRSSAFFSSTGTHCGHVCYRGRPSSEVHMHCVGGQSSLVSVFKQEA